MLFRALHSSEYRSPLLFAVPAFLHIEILLYPKYIYPKKHISWISINDYQYKIVVKKFFNYGRLFGQNQMIINHKIILFSTHIKIFLNKFSSILYKLLLIYKQKSLCFII